MKYQRSLVYLSMWNDHELKKSLSAWDTSSAPLWALRRAGLLIEVGNHQSAERTLKEALEDLRTMADEGTPETWSIESWVVFLLRYLERTEWFHSLQATQEQTQSTDSGQPTESPDAISGEHGAEVYQVQKKPPTRREESPATDDDPTGLQATLNWLLARSCDPVEILQWLEEQNSREFTRTPATSRGKASIRDARQVTFISVAAVSTNEQSPPIEHCG